ncbi:MAG: hypothetical protein J0H70_05510, partial [Microbacterium chocolatum]|nr:hypothetical protein [Microbacterium chocolatum]
MDAADGHTTGVRERGDDDPTGTQAVADLPVLSRWGVDDLGWALDTGAAAVYVLTNTRSHDAETAA